MEELNLDFLKDVSLDPVKILAPVKKVRTPKLPPDTVDIRVFASGKCYPSKAFVFASELQFSDRVSNEDGSFTITGNGLDVFSSKEWSMVQGKMPQDILFCAAVPKAEAKVDLWASTKYNEDDSPKADVFTQGGGKFVKDSLLPMLADVYDVNWDVTEYVDLKVSDQVLATENNIYHIPKTVASGPNKGQPTFVRRDDIDIHPLIVTHVEKSGENAAVDNAKETEAPDLSDSSDTDAEIDTGWEKQLGDV